MRRVLRENLPCALAAAAGCAMLGWLGLYGPGWNDYETEVKPAIEALTAGRLHDFLSLAPIYGGSLIERAPFALMPGIWGAGEPVVYRFLALPCLIASALLATWIVARMRAAGSPSAARAVALGLLAANPITLLALEIGHPEELLGASLCLAAVLLASAATVERRRSLLVGGLLGLAIANKQWALLATGPVLLALPHDRRRLAAIAAAGLVAAIEAPLLLAGSGAYIHGAGAVAASPSVIFQPWQVFWFFAHHGAPVHGLFGEVKTGYRDAPAWAGEISHPLVLAAGLGIAVWMSLRVRRERLGIASALLSLAVVMLARCVLDTWDTVYYLVPSILALTAWESTAASHRLPVLSLAVTVVVWAQFKWLPGHLSADAQAAVFLLWSIVLLCALAAALMRGLPARPASPESRGRQRRMRPFAGPEDRPRLGLPRHAMTVRSFESPVSTSRPPSLTTTRSSIRTPSTSGR